MVILYYIIAVIFVMISISGVMLNSDILYSTCLIMSGLWGIMAQLEKIYEK